MKIRVECRTIAEYEAAISAGNIAVIFNLHVVAWGSSHVEARGSSHVVAWGSSHVEAWESSHVVARGSSHVVAWESSHVVARGSSHVEARESSHVEAWESSHVVAWGSSHVEAWESSHVVAWGNVFVRLYSALKITASSSVVVMVHGKAGTMTGGRRLKAAKPKTALAWCKHWGVEVKAGIALLFKAVDDDYSTENARKNGISYKPGNTPTAPDWDGGKKECGGGLHFSPSPAMALEFNSRAKRFVACPVAIKGLSIHPDGVYPQKVKAKGCAKPVYEVDRKGNRV